MIDLEKMIKRYSRVIDNPRPDTCKGCKYAYIDKVDNATCTLIDGSFEDVCINYEIDNDLVSYNCPLLEADSEEYKDISEILEALKELKDLRVNFKIIVDKIDRIYYKQFPDKIKEDKL